MNEESKKLTPEVRKNIVIPAIKKDLERLPDYDGFGNSNSATKKELTSWVNELESDKYISDEVQYFMKMNSDWEYSSLCDYLP